MTFLPIVSRELAVAARRKATHWTRFLFALAGILISAWILAMLSGSFPQEAAKVLFGVMSGMMTLYCSLAGIRFTADCLSVERREGTLGLLFLTNLRGHDVILGKLVASSVDAFYGVLAIVPVLALPLLMGGVTFGEFGRMSLVAMDTLFFSLSAGMLISAIARSPQSAAWGTLLLLLAVAVGMPLLDSHFFHSSGTTGIGIPWGFILSPAFAFAAGFDTLYSRYPWHFWGALGSMQAMAWIWLALAAMILPRTWQDRPSGGAAEGLRSRVLNWLRGTGAGSVGFRRGLLDRNAYFWLSSRQRWRLWMPWLVLVLLACIWVWGWHEFKEDWLNPGIYFTTGIVLNLLFRIWFSAETCRQLAEDHHSGALELLLSTPLTVNEIITGQFLSLRRMFAWPLAVSFMVQLLLFRATLKEVDYGSERMTWICCWSGMLLMTAFDLVALFWVSLWRGVTSRHPNRAASNSVALVFLPSWGVVLMVTMMMVVGNSGGGDGWQTVMALWFLSGLITNSVLCVWARTKLQQEFRSAAQRRFEPPKGLMELFTEK